MADEFQTVIYGENWWSSVIDGWSGDLGAVKDIAFTESDSVSDVSIASHETPKAQNSESSTGSGSIFLNSALQMMGSSFSSSPTSDWNQSSLYNNIGDFESTLDGLLGEETIGKDSSINSLKTCVVQVDEELVPGKYGNPCTMFEHLLEHETRHEKLLFDNDFSINRSSPDDFEAKRSSSKLKFIDCSYSQLMNKHESIDHESKRQRIEAPSPLPTFKVRKEKMGDRITALQQLVSPFGKTDTASVLHEAVEYIRFLHDQISVFSTSSMKTEHLDREQQEAGKQDLRRQGLCLVPICSTFPLVNDITPGFWMPANPNYALNFR